MSFPQTHLLGLAFAGLTLSACGTVSEGPRATSSYPLGGAQIHGAQEAQAALDSGLTRSQILMRSGIDFLRKGDLERAQAVFNTALKFDFDNAQLHFLNALAYHQAYLRGAADHFALAKAGYRTALLRDPALAGLAFLQLGRLYLEAKDHAAAKQAFAMAVDANPQSTDALYGLAQAAALDGDLATSYWAARQLDQMQWGDPALLRLKAIQAALAQQGERARAWAADYARASKDRAGALYLQGRVNQLLTIKTALRDEDTGGLTQTRTPAAPGAQAPATGEPPQILKWFRCDNAPGIPSRTGPAPAGAAANDENITTTPLPAPCPGELPKTAIIEVTMLQTEDSKGENQGVNLLDGLSAIFTLQRARSYTRSSNVSEEVRTNNFVIANAVDNAVDVLRYSLNIANAAYTRSEVLARPTLAAIDRVPAVFFSGATITLGVAGVGGGASTVVDKPVGVSLTVTPTFIDDDNILVSMRATRSFIETNLVPSGSSILLQQSRNSINASSRLKFGETFVVSGLMASQNTLSQSGTPVLQDIPVLQYLFKRSAKLDASLQILTMITLRRPPDDALKTAANAGAAPHRLSATVDKFVKLQAIPPVIDDILARLTAEHQRYRWLRERDLMPENVAPKAGLERLLDDLKEIIYY
ncbi:tetratricopeptide (TPR) repeat protein [Oxalobacteraceae bacterium GrIS 1.11]